MAWFAGRADLRAPGRLDRGDRRGGRRDRLLAPGRARHEPHAAVALIAAAGEITGRLHRVDGLAQGLLGHAGQRGQVGNPDAVRRDHLEYPPVTAAQVRELAEPGGPEVRGHPPGDRLQPPGQVIRQMIKGNGLARSHKVTLLSLQMDRLPYFSEAVGGAMDLPGEAALPTAELAAVASAASGHDVPDPVACAAPVAYNWGSPATAGLWRVDVREGSPGRPGRLQLLRQAAPGHPPLAGACLHPRGAAGRLHRLLPLALRARHVRMRHRVGAARRHADARPAPREVRRCRPHRAVVGVHHPAPGTVGPPGLRARRVPARAPGRPQAGGRAGQREPPGESARPVPGLFPAAIHRDPGPARPAAAPASKAPCGATRWWPRPCAGPAIRDCRRRCWRSANGCRS